MEDVWGTVDGDGDGDGDDGGRRRGYNMAPPPPYLKRGRWSRRGLAACDKKKMWRTHYRQDPGISSRLGWLVLVIL